MFLCVYVWFLSVLWSLATCVVPSPLTSAAAAAAAAAKRTSAPGSWLDPSRMQEVSWMKYDLNAHAEMGNITLEANSICLHALKIQRFITHQLWCIWENFNVYRCGLSRRGDVCINIPQPRCCFSLWTQHAEWITVASFICLGSFPGQQWKSKWIMSVCFVGFCPIWKTGGNQCFFNFQIRDVT